jgi:hypothetical protein
MKNHVRLTRAEIVFDFIQNPLDFFLLGKRVMRDLGRGVFKKYQNV